MLRSVCHLVLKARLEILALAILGVVALAAGISEAPLVDWDEATYAEVAHEAVSNRSYLDFTWNGEAYLKKPPALFWMMAASFKAFGEAEWSARLPSVVMGIGTLLLIYLSAAAVAGRLAGIFAALIPLTFYFFISRGGRECATDAPLVFFSTLAIYALGRIGTSLRWSAIVGVACGCAILSKGLAGIIPLAVAAISVLAIPGFTAIGFSGIVLIMATTVAVAAPWFVYQAVDHGTLFWSIYVKQETLLRLASNLQDNREGSYNTLRTFAGEVQHLWPLLLPLIGLCVMAARFGIVRAVRRIPAAVIAWMLWLVLALGAACAVQTKLGWYVLPALIPVALLGGTVLGYGFAKTGRAERYCAALAGAALVLLAVETPARWQLIEQGFRLQRERSRPSYIIGAQAREFAALREGGSLFFAGVPLPTLVYYSGMLCHFVRPPNPGFELTDLDGNPVSILYHEVVMRAANGELMALANFDEEWNRSGPDDERDSSAYAPSDW